jgi:hypothetical protein
VGVTFCGVPVTQGAVPLVSDALFILRTAVALETCEGCQCDVNSDGTITTTDALIDLKKVVELPVDLNCFEAVDGTTTTVPGSTTTTSTTSTTFAGN